MQHSSQNFDFLKDGPDPVFFQLAWAAERSAIADPNTALIKLRQLGEAFARHAAAMYGVWTGQSNQIDLLRALETRGVISGELPALFHQLRKHGNAAAHEFVGSPQIAVASLRCARTIAIWFHRTFGGVDAQSFRPGPFVPPVDPAEKEREILEEIARLRSEVVAQRNAVEEARRLAELETRRRAAAEMAASQAEAERAEWEALAAIIEEESKEKLAEFERTLPIRQEKAEQASDKDKRVQFARAAQASSQIELDEATTRLLIDEQLRNAGWEADSRALRYGLGVRPEAGRRLAIAEWPTDSGPADYVLFDGLTPLGVVEAKRKSRNAAGAIEQAKRYAHDFNAAGTTLANAAGWPMSTTEPGRYLVPFLYATNGRPFLRQFTQESGVWFLDARRPSNHPRPLDGWHSPDTLRAMLAADVDEADERLRREPTDYLRLRDYQLRAIQKVEEAIAAGQRELLVAMATGTGKTRTIIGLIYRLLKSRRVRRVLFLVDRTALGEQAQAAFKEMQLEGTHTFADTYEVRELDDQTADAETRVHVATVQGMVRRIFGSETPFPIDTYDCIVIDESHRGYTLDREMTEGEQELRDWSEYVSTYRRVLDHFDAIKIGLTATPALHTREIFGDPVFQYSYREAVVDGFLIDHEPPKRIHTRLSEQGIHIPAGQQVPRLGPDGGVQLELLPDELNFDIEDFNRQVLTEGFNRAVAQSLADDYDPRIEQGKMLVFCANDRHADTFVQVFKEELTKRYGAIDDGAIRKITGSIDRPLEAIRRFRNEQFPAVAVTVDLLTTGVDVPPITHLVFLRRVRSRILYEQMLGRATRLCPEIDKEVFYIHDAVGLYDALEPFTAMKPVVKDVQVSVRQLVQELVDDTAHGVTGADDSRSHADEVFDQLVARLRRAVRRAEKREDSPEWRELQGTVEDAFDVELGRLPDRIRQMGAIEASRYFGAKGELVGLLEKLVTWHDGGSGPVIHDGPDEVTRIEIGYGPGKMRPEDYIEGFGRFVNENLNRLPALSMVVTRPRDLTREQLKELKLALDEAGYTEAWLTTAWRQLRNEDIAATIIGFVRQQALGSPLVPYADRVDAALRKVLAAHPWKPPQRKWLERIGHQLKKEVVIDRSIFDQGAFVANGGWKGIDRVLEGRLSDVLGELSEEIWRDSA